MEEEEKKSRGWEEEGEGEKGEEDAQDGWWEQGKGKGSVSGVGFVLEENPFSSCMKSSEEIQLSLMEETMITKFLPAHMSIVATIQTTIYTYWAFPGHQTPCYVLCK